MLPAPLDLTTGRKAPPVVRSFQRTVPLDLSQRTCSKPGNCPDFTPPRYEPIGCVTSASCNEDPNSTKSVIKPIAERGGFDDLPAEFHASSPENWVAFEHGSRSDDNQVAGQGVSADASSSRINNQAGQGVSAEPHACSSEDRILSGIGVNNSVANEGGPAEHLEEDFLANPRTDNNVIEECESNNIIIIEKVRQREQAPPRKPLVTLPLETNHSSDSIPHQPKAHTSPPSSVKARGSSLKDVTKNKYTRETLSFAIEQVRNGSMTQYKASKDFSIPKNTLRYRLSEKFKHNSRRGPETVLSSEEEYKIVCWIKEMQRKAFPVTTEALRRKIATFLKANPRPNPFRDNTPRRHWMEGFLRRHKDVSIRTPEAISKASANVSESDLRGWHAQVGQYARDNGLEDVLEDPSRMLSGDETGMPMNVTAQKVLAERGSQNVSIVEPGNSKETTTVLFTFSADGHAYPPLVILPQQRIGKEIAQHYPGDWGLGGTESGWMDTANFIGHIKKVLHPALVKRNVQFPVIYFVDGHKSHLSLAVVETCLKLKIILISLFPNSTRIIQPADVGVFGPLKHFWREEVAKFKTENGENAKITPVTFPAILQSAMHQAFKIQTIIQSFKLCGIYPFNADAIDYRKCFGKSRKGPDNAQSQSISSPPEESEENVMTQLGSRFNHDHTDHNSDYSSFNSTDIALEPSSSSRSYDEPSSSSRSYGVMDTSWQDSYGETAEPIPLDTSLSVTSHPPNHSSSGGPPSLECDISKYLTTPKTPERARKHINYKMKMNPVLTAAERLEEIRRIEEEKKNLLQRKIEMAEKKVLQKADSEVEKKKRIEERKRKAEENKAAREEKQRKSEERKKKSEEKKAELEKAKKKKLEERKNKAADRKRKQEEVAEKKREREAKKKKTAQPERMPPSDEDSLSSEESEDEIEDNL